MSSLAQKLRLPDGERVAVINAPDGYHEWLGVAGGASGDDLDFVQLFVRNVDELRTLGPGATDLPATPWWHRRDVLGELTGASGFVAVAQVSIDDHWTAIRFKRPA